MKEIIVLIEHLKGKISDNSFEAITAARLLSNAANSKVTAVLLTDSGGNLIKDITAKTDNILLVEDKNFAVFNSCLYEKALFELIRPRRPSIILMGHTSSGIELAPALAQRLNIGLITDCISLDYKESGFTAVKKVYEGKIDSRSSYKSAETVMATLRPGSYKTEEMPPLDAKIEKISLSALEEPAYKKFIEYVESAAGEVDLSGAQIIISVGRGIGEEKNMVIIRELADAIGGAVGCSRPIVDKKWLPKDRQVGTSGKIVKPKVYIAIGISGSFQHVEGMKNAENIIAINKDPRAPIFEVAHLAIVDDLFKVVPKLTEKIKVVRK